MKTVSPDSSSFRVKGIVFFVFMSVLMLGGLLYFAANSPWIIKKAADEFAPRYNISYDALKGNVLTGIEIETPRYRGEPLAERIALKWNPNMLLHKKIAVSKLQIEKANIDIIEKLIASFESKTPKEEAKPFDFTVDIGEISIGVDSFVRQNIAVFDVRLEAEKIVYDRDAFTVEGARLEVDTNVTQIQLQADLLDQVLEVESLSLKNINVQTLEKILFGRDNNTTQNIPPQEEDTNQKTKKSPFVPKYVKIKQAEITFLSTVYDPLELEHFMLSGEGLIFDVEKLLIEQGGIDLNTTANLGSILYKGKIHQNMLSGTMQLSPSEALFDLYKLPVRKEAFGKIVMDFNASKEQITAEIKAKATQVLKGKEGEFNFDIDDLRSHVVYEINSKTLEAVSHLMITTPYAKGISLSNRFEMDNNISYSGDIKAQALTGIDPQLIEFLKHPVLDYEGNASSIQVQLDSDNIKGHITSSDFKQGMLHLETKETISLEGIVDLPKELKEAKGSVIVDFPFNFDSNQTFKGKANINSNLADVDADIFYGKKLQIVLQGIVPKNSLLRPYIKELKWDALSPLKADITWSDKTLVAAVDAKALKLSISHNQTNAKINGKLTVGGMNAEIDGLLNKKFTVNINTHSFQSLIQNIQSVYMLEEAPKIDGNAEILAVVTELKNIELRLTSPKIVYHADRKTKYTLTDILLKSRLEASKLILENYTLTYDGQKFFAAKPSTIQRDGDILRLSEFWVNDELKTEGFYNMKTSKGDFSATANMLHVSHERAEFDSKIDLKASLDGNKTSVKGEIVLLGGNIYYDMSQKSFASDEDIIMVQEMKKKQSPFMENLSTEIQVKTQKPLLYKEGDIDIQIIADLGIYKSEYAPFAVIGTVEIPEGGSYMFEDKKFIFKKSYLYFTGNPGKPVLDARIGYRSLNHFITIVATGTPDAPIINFSSSPSLSREEILSVILFDSEAGAGTNNGDDMMKMMGGAMAKSALVNAGVKIDHLVLGEDNSVEVGKKLTDRITIIYVNDEISSVKLKYRHTPHTESVIEASEISQSYDIIYKTDF